jgi:DNA-binding transcriptional LysR family regulator
VRALAIDCAITSSRVTDPKIDGAPLHEERYVFVGQPALLRRSPLARPEHAGAHTLIDATEELPLFAYTRDASAGIDSTRFARVLRMGTIAAMRELVLRGEGVAVLPEYFVAADLRARRLARVLPKVQPRSDLFRLLFRADDPRRSVYETLATLLRTCPLR